MKKKHPIDKIIETIMSHQLLHMTRKANEYVIPFSKFSKKQARSVIKTILSITHRDSGGYNKKFRNAISDFFDFPIAEEGYLETIHSEISRRVKLGNPSMDEILEMLHEIMNEEENNEEETP